MLRKYVVLIIAFAAFVSGAHAESGIIEAGDNLTADLSNNAYIHVPGIFTFTNFSVTSGQLQFWLNNSKLQWRTNTNKTLTNIRFSVAKDNFTFNASGASGYLNFSALMNNASSNYSFYLNGTFQNFVNSISDRTVTVNYTGTWSDHVFMIIPSLEITLPKPNITSWGNTNTSNNNLTLTIPRDTNITFNTTSNQTIDTWFWVGSTQINGSNSNESYAFKNFTMTGSQNVSVYGTNVNGSTQTIIWTVNVLGIEGLTLSGYVSNTLELPLENTRIDFNNSHCFTNTTGYFEFAGINEGTYTVLSRAIGYKNNSVVIDITSNTIFNISMKEKQPVAVIQDTPGFESILMMISIVTIYIIRRRKIKNI